MKLKSRLVLAAAIALSACQAPIDETGSMQEPIIGGVTDNGDPAVVAILASDGSMCSGTLISHRVILTAAHCVALGQSGWSIYFGTDASNAYWSGDTIDVVAHWSHSSFNVDNLENGYDIGLLAMNQDGPTDPLPINRTTPVSWEPYWGYDLRLVGFGNTSGGDWGSGAGIKRQVTSQIDYTTSKLIYYGNSSANTCSGDSGGPNFLTMRGDRETVAAVTSFGDENCTVLGASTRVDRYLDDIKSFVQSHDDVSCDADGACGFDCGEPDPDCPCETDGFCTTACADPDDDYDCPEGCGSDGYCAEGCPRMDPDCDPCSADGLCATDCISRDPDCPIGEVGDACGTNDDCASGWCIAAPDDGSLAFCTESCGSCPGGMRCAESTSGSLCVYDGPTPGSLGSSCADSNGCSSGYCITAGNQQFCSRVCDDASPCPSDYDCVATTGSENLCVPAGDDDGGGCRVADATDGVIPRRNLGGGITAMLAIALLGLVSLRRNRG